MKKRLPLLTTLFFLFVSFVEIPSVFPSFFFVSGFVVGSGGRDLDRMMVTNNVGGGVKEDSSSSSSSVENSAEADQLARFAVEEHNKRGENSNSNSPVVEFFRLVKAEKQVVAGTLHHLTLEGIEAGRKMIYEAKVWVKPWMDFKELQDFKAAGTAPAATTFTASDLGAKKPPPAAAGWRQVPKHDPVVQDAANHAVKAIQQRSNSLFPYELLDVLLAQAEVMEEVAKFNLHLKVKRGDKEEKFKVEVHKNMEGNFLLNQMQQDHSA